MKQKTRQVIGRKSVNIHSIKNKEKYEFCTEILGN